MFNHFVAVLLVILLTACSSVPRSVPPRTSGGSQTSAAVENQVASIAPEGPDGEAKPEPGAPGPARVIVAVLLIALIVVGLAAISRSVSRDFARSCCKVQ